MPHQDKNGAKVQCTVGAIVCDLEPFMAKYRERFFNLPLKPEIWLVDDATQRHPWPVIFKNPKILISRRFMLRNTKTTAVAAVTAVTAVTAAT